MTLGNFDGIHLGHQALLDRVMQVSQKTGLASCVVTYDPNPAIVLGKKPEMKSLMTFADKEKWIRQKGIDFLVVLPFNKELAEMSAESFLEEILLKQLKAKDIIIGFNHCFGKERRGNYELLKEYSKKLKYSVEKVDPIFLKEIKLSSSYVRTLISEGNVKEAARCLNRFYSVPGTVVGGHKRGKKNRISYGERSTERGYSPSRHRSLRGIHHRGRNRIFLHDQHRSEPHLRGKRGHFGIQHIRLSGKYLRRRDKNRVHRKNSKRDQIFQRRKSDRPTQTRRNFSKKHP